MNIMSKSNLTSNTNAQVNEVLNDQLLIGKSQRDKFLEEAKMDSSGGKGNRLMGTGNAYNIILHVVTDQPSATTRE
jgi:hypothetical protein